MAKDTESQAVYAPLLDDEDGTQSRSDSPISKHSALKLRRLRAIYPGLLVSILFNFILLLAVFYLIRLPKKTTSCNPDLIYSPMESVVEYEAVKFHRGFGHDIPIYEMPPSAEVDKAWKDLYQDYLASKATRAEAEQMVNKTILVQDKSGYMVGIDVFHQLHCLDMMRKLLHPDDYPIATHPELNVTIGHVRHCVGVLRQPLMCFGDVSPGVWQWSEKLGRVAARDDVLHTCRKWDKLVDWAKSPERLLANEDYTWDFSHRVDDDLEVKGYQGPGHHDH